MTPIRIARDGVIWYSSNSRAKLIVGSYVRRSPGYGGHAGYDVTVHGRTAHAPRYVDIGHVVQALLAEAHQVNRVERLSPTERALLRRMPGRAQTIVLDALGDPALNPLCLPLDKVMNVKRRWGEPVTLLRRTIWWRLRQQQYADGSAWSFPAIAQWFDCHHTSVLHGVRRYEEQHPEVRMREAA